MNNNFEENNCAKIGWAVGDYIDLNTKERFLAVWPANNPIGNEITGTPICLVSPKISENEHDYNNANLIAAAPKMLETLKLIREVVGRGDKINKIHFANIERAIMNASGKGLE